MANLIAVSVTEVSGKTLDATTTYQLPVAKILSVKTDGGSGSIIYVEDEGGQLEKKKYTVTEAPGAITTAANA